MNCINDIFSISLLLIAILNVDKMLIINLNVLKKNYNLLSLYSFFKKKVYLVSIFNSVETMYFD